MKFPQLPTSIQKVVSKITDKEANKPEQKLKLWSERLKKAKDDYDLSFFDKMEAEYRGDHEVYPNINATGDTSSRRKANNVYNIAYEFIETQVDPTIPQPACQSRLQGFEEQAQMAEDSTKNDLLDGNIDAINDLAERNTPMHGISCIWVDWDSDYKHPMYRGRIVLRGLHAKQVIPQPKVWAVQDMDYFFILLSSTKKYVKDRFGVEVKDGEEFPEINQLLDSTMGDTGGDKVTLCIAYYKDKYGDIGRFIWCNDEVCEDMPKYYAHRLQRCKACGTPQGMEENCEVCGSNKWKESVEETEVLVEDVVLFDGTTIPAGTEVPYFSPNRYPLVTRINVPLNFSFAGQSDIAVVLDQIDSIKKIVSRIEEKLLRGGNIIAALEDHTFSLTNELYQIVRGGTNQLAALRGIPLDADISKDLAFAQQQYKWAQSCLGITDSFQGKPDPTATSGVAKQAQIQQASGRLASKQNNKYSAYKDLFEIMFEMRLALCDEPRPYVRTKEDGDDEYGYFDKHMFLMQDATGAWHYNTDFLWTADAGAGLPKDKVWLFQQANEMLGTGAFVANPATIRYWKILEGLHFPGAKDIQAQLDDEWQKQQEMQAQMQMQPPLPPGGGMIG